MRLLQLLPHLVIGYILGALLMDRLVIGPHYHQPEAHARVERKIDNFLEELMAKL